jgi:AcrR family transcriptional regulator
MNEHTGTRYHHGDLRKALMDAGEVELAEKGIEGFTLRGCAKRAGVSHAAPAHHFKDVNGLLTALAAEGFDRLVAAMRARQAVAKQTPRLQFIAAGLGYLDFGKANKALFRLMFSSHKPDFGSGELKRSAAAAFDILIEIVRNVAGADPRGNAKLMRDVAAAWAMAHGLADLALSNRMKFLDAAPGLSEDEVYAEIIARSVPDGAKRTARSRKT